MAYFSLAVQGEPPVDLPPPRQGITRPLAKIGSLHTTLDGSQVQVTVGRRRTWTIPYGLITDAEYAALETWHDGSRGPGPYELRERGGDPVLVNVVELADPTIIQVGRVSTTLVLTQAVAT